MSPLVSIIIPLYNHAQFIVHCLNSIRNDNYPNKEIIIIDDGSKDLSASVVQEWYRTHRDSLAFGFTFKQRENRGVTKTLNELIGLAKGEFIAVLASDDYLLPGGIEARLQYLAEHPGKLAVFGDSVVVDNEGQTVHLSGISDLYKGCSGYLKHDELQAIELIMNWAVPGPGFMARHELYEIVGLYDESLTVEDWDMYLRIASRRALGFISVPVAAYRYHGANSVVSAGSRLSQLESLLRTARKNLRLFSGLEFYSLLSRYFMIKHEMQIISKNTVRRFIYRKIGKLLQKNVQNKIIKIAERTVEGEGRNTIF